jgi:ribosomal protein S18 acetylase RimI-like enzyme
MKIHSPVDVDCRIMSEDTVRNVLPNDWPAIIDLDTSYETDCAFAVEAGADGDLRLASQRLLERERRDFHIDLTADGWTRGWLCESEGKVVGFLGTEYHEWNRRLVVWHFYVDLRYRRRGFGRRLIERAVTEGLRSGAKSVWVETSNYNAPGIACYRKLAFEVCGFDRSLYYGTPRANEFGVFLWRPLRAGQLGECG